MRFVQLFALIRAEVQVDAVPTPNRRMREGPASIQEAGPSRTCAGKIDAPSALSTYGFGCAVRGAGSLRGGSLRAGWLLLDPELDDELSVPRACVGVAADGLGSRGV